MKSALNTAALITFAFIVSGCATSGASPNGWALIKQEKIPAFVTDNAKAIKTGRACAQNVLSVYASGDASIEAAKKEGNITRVADVAYEMENYVVFGKVCTVVRGE
jgi:hypothetical protein